MPKVQKPRAPRAQTSTEQKRTRAARVEEEGLEMDFRCKRCEEKKLRCFVETSTGRCAGCISVGAECSLFVSEREWEEVQAECERKELELAQAEERQALAAAESSRLRRELLEVKSKKRIFARRDLAIIAVQDRAKEQAEGSSAPGGTGFPVVEPSLSGPSADLGGLQADSFDPLSFDYFLSLESPALSSLDAVPDFFDPVLVVFELYFRC
ncbi:GAL4 domain containing protein [Pyrenophora tritici-repentis]|nr:GAL4 domain containing protein [Pyrenophora tritici-repentis]